MLRPSSTFVALLLCTKYVRILGSKLVRTYVTIVPGGIKLRVRTGDKSEELMIDEIFKKGVYETEYKVAPGDTVVDVGANIGAFSLKASKLVGKSGQILALEPERTNFGLLTGNVKLNRAINIRTRKLAVGESPRNTKLYVYQKRGNNSLTYRQRERLENVECVQMDTLDNIFESEGLSKIDFLKIDVEGAELGVLRGGKDCIGKYRPRIALETHSWGPSMEILVGLLRDYGYNSFGQVDGGRDLGMVYAS